MPALLALWALVGGACSTVSPRRSPVPERQAAPVAPDAGTGVTPAVFVDASAPPGGDGSREHPLRGIPDRARGRFSLAAGVYPGALVLEDVELVGGPAVVLAATPPATCLRTRGTVRLERVQIQGGAAGVVVEGGRTFLTDVSISGQRGPSVEVSAGAELILGASTVQASVSAVPGVRVLPGGKAELTRVRFQGPFQRAVDAKSPAALRLSEIEVQDAVTGLWLNGGAGVVEGLDVRGGRGPAVFVAGATVQLRDLRVGGHEYGLLTGDGARIDGRGIRSSGATLAGVALVKSKGTLEDVHVESAGSLGGVQLISSEVRLRGLDVQGGRSSGLLARDAQVTLEGATFRGPSGVDSSDGDAVQIRRGTATLGGVRVQDCSGAGVVAAEAATVTLSRVAVSGAAIAGVVVETEAHLSGTEVSVERTSGPAVLVTDRGNAQLRGMATRENRDGALWAECSQGVKVEIDGWTGDVTPQPAPCVRGVWVPTPRR